MIDDAIPTAIRTLLLEPYAAVPVERIGTGLSKARIWKCKTPTEFACLRAWPHGHPDYHRLREIHRAMQRLTEHGLDFTPRVYCNNRGESFASDGVRFWELTSWLPGNADYLERPSETKLLSAARAIAAIHDAWAIDAQTSLSPTVADRCTRLERWLRELSPVELRVHHMQGAGRESKLAKETCLALRRTGPGLLQRLAALRKSQTSVHSVLRDLWSDHVLYCGESVSGIIDFGALRIDEPTTDLVRLLGSLEPHDADKRERALLAYERARKIPLPVDRERFATLDQAATLLSAAQWMQWLVIDPQEFHRPRSQLLDRWQQFLSRL